MKSGDDNNKEAKFYQDPLFHCIHNFDSCKDENIIYIIQDELHILLNSFLDPLELPNKFKIIYPFIDSLPEVVKKRLQALFLLLKKSSDKRGFNFNDSLRFLHKNYLFRLNPEIFAKILSTLYCDLNANIHNINYRKKLKIVEFGKIKDEEYETTFLKPILLLKSFSRKYLSKYLQNFILHGSLSTLDYVEGWSDVDTYAIIKRDTILDWRLLLKLRKLTFKNFRYFLLIDPYQHHGTFFVTEIDTQFYPQAYLPFIVLKNSKSFFDSEKIEFIERSEDIERIFKLRETPEIFKKAYITNFHLKNYYLAKLYISYLLIFPTYYLEAKGIHVYKRDSFKLIKRELKEKEWNIIEIASKCRKLYTKKQLLQQFTSITINMQENPFMSLFIHFLFKNDIQKEFAQILRSITKDVLLFSERMLRKLV